jgi:hypothetical protein
MTLTLVALALLLVLLLIAELPPRHPAAHR